MAILLLEDKLGVTQGYQETWRSMCMKAQVNPDEIVHRSVWRSPIVKQHSLLIRKGNRKTPGYNPDGSVQNVITQWILSLVAQVQPEIIICQDLALLGQIESRWESATIDYMRGGLYNFYGHPFYIMTPISAVNTKKSTKDIAIMNQGVYTKEEWDDKFFNKGTDGDDESNNDDDDEDEEVTDVWLEPYIVDMGRWILGKDFAKLSRLIQRFRREGFIERRPNIRIVMGRDDAKEAEEFLMESILIANDIETNPKEGLMTVNGYTGLHNSGEKRTYVFPFYSDKNFRMGTPPDLGEFVRVSARVNSSGIPFTFQNGGYDLFWHLVYNMPVANYALDSMTMFWSLFPELPKRLDFISSILLDDYKYWKGAGKSDDYYTYLIYNGLDNDRTLDDTIVLVNMLEGDSRALENFWHAHMRVIAGLEMGVKGVKSDEAQRISHKLTLETKAAEGLAKLRYLVADDEFNPNSPK
jgi:hypothetical protein